MAAGKDERLRFRDPGPCLPLPLPRGRPRQLDCWAVQVLTVAQRDMRLESRPQEPKLLSLVLRWESVDGIRFWGWAPSESCSPGRLACCPPAFFTSSFPTGAAAGLPVQPPSPAAPPTAVRVGAQRWGCRVEEMPRLWLWGSGPGASPSLPPRRVCAVPGVRRGRDGFHGGRSVPG